MMALIVACGRRDVSPLPFRYPASLYTRRVQGTVTLRLVVDRDGCVAADSTTVDEPSGYPALDTAALHGVARGSDAL